MTFLTIYLLTSLGFGINSHIDCVKNPPKRVISEKECKVIGYVSAPLFPVFIYKEVKRKFNKVGE